MTKISNLKSQISKSQQGQVMLLSILIISGTILGATTIAGLLTVNQIRQATNVGYSTQALFAADTGIEWELFKYFKQDLFQPENSPTAQENLDRLAPNMSNNSCVFSEKIDAGGDFQGIAIRAVGCAGGSMSINCEAIRCPRPVNRAFEIFLQEQSSP